MHKTIIFIILSIYMSSQVFKKIYKTDRNLENDYVIELITECNYSVEIHKNIPTEDGYLLTMHRITGSKDTPVPPVPVPSIQNGINKTSNITNKVPVLLMHGLFGSSEHFLVLGCNNSIAYLLSNQGYDVWLGNLRSVSYSRHHVSLDPDGVDYWQFSFDEFARYDLPRLIDYILETTGQKKFMYIGHSQGNYIFYMMCSLQPEYGSKVQLFVQFSPFATAKNFPHPYWRYIFNCPQLIHMQKIFNWFGLYELTFGRDFNRLYAGKLCTGIFNPLCKYTIYLISGLLPENIPDDMLERLLKNAPEPASTKHIIHCCQMHLNDIERMFDYGTPELNLQHYGEQTPPLYDLTLTTTPKALYYSSNDWFLSLKEAEGIVNKVTNVVDSLRLDNFSHLDFLFVNKTSESLYVRVLNLMNKFREKVND